MEKSIFENLEIHNVKVDRFDVDGKKFTKKSRKLKSENFSKSRKSKSNKAAKSKKWSKSGNSPNFDTMKARPCFLISNVRTAFNCL